VIGLGFDFDSWTEISCLPSISPSTRNSICASCAGGANTSKYACGLSLVIENAPKVIRAMSLTWPDILVLIALLKVLPSESNSFFNIVRRRERIAELSPFSISSSISELLLIISAYQYKCPLGMKAKPIRRRCQILYRLAICQYILLPPPEKGIRFALAMICCLWHHLSFLIRHFRSPYRSSIASNISSPSRRQFELYPGPECLAPALRACFAMFEVPRSVSPSALPSFPQPAAA
jgi:hypothetical protein